MNSIIVNNCQDILTADPLTCVCVCVCVFAVRRYRNSWPADCSADDIGDRHHESGQGHRHDAIRSWVAVAVRRVGVAHDDVGRLRQSGRVFRGFLVSFQVVLHPPHIHLVSVLVADDVEVLFTDVLHLDVHHAVRCAVDVQVHLEVHQMISQGANWRRKYLHANHHCNAHLADIDKNWSRTKSCLQATVGPIACSIQQVLRRYADQVIFWIPIYQKLCKEIMRL